MCVCVCVPFLSTRPLLGSWSVRLVGQALWVWPSSGAAAVLGSSWALSSSTQHLRDLLCFSAPPRSQLSAPPLLICYLGSYQELSWGEGWVRLWLHLISLGLKGLEDELRSPSLGGPRAKLCPLQDLRQLLSSNQLSLREPPGGWTESGCQAQIHTPATDGGKFGWLLLMLHRAPLPGRPTPLPA